MVLVFKFANISESFSGMWLITALSRIAYNENIYDMPLEMILADATSGVLYNRHLHVGNDSEVYTQLFASFDYGKNWIFREENIGDKTYRSANIDGVIYRGGYDGTFESKDYGNNFYQIEGGEGMETGLQYGEGFRVWCSKPYQGRIFHSYDFFNTFTEFPIDSQFVYIDPDVYRGALQGEVYVSSMFTNANNEIYKVSFSADTGHTFRKVYESESYSPGGYPPVFMSDREPGVFYIVRTYIVEDSNSWEDYKKLCIHYYRDYGETLVDIYCHDITKDYGKTCEAITDLALEKCNDNCILLSWSEPESSLPIEGYHIYRNEQLLNEQLTINTTYYDENLPNGDYEYYVVTHYTTGCVSDTSNHVAEKVELGVKGVKELEGVRLFPNPTTGELTINNEQLTMNNVEVFDVYGRKQKAESRRQNVIDISELQAGIYFVRVTTEKGVITKKVVKY